MGTQQEGSHRQAGTRALCRKGASPWISDFQPPELCERHACCLSPQLTVFVATVELAHPPKPKSWIHLSGPWIWGLNSPFSHPAKSPLGATPRGPKGKETDLPPKLAHIGNIREVPHQDRRARRDRDPGFASRQERGLHGTPHSVQMRARDPGPHTLLPGASASLKGDVQWMRLEEPSHPCPLHTHG